jgi:hypothetical protein
MDLAAALIQAIEEQREQLNSSRIARGEPGRVEIHVNPTVNRLYIEVLVPDKRRVA